MRTRAAPGVVLCLALLVAACDGTQSQGESAPTPASTDPPASTGTPSPATPSPPADPTSSPDTDPARGEVTIAVAGDVHFEGPLRERLLADPATALAPATRTLAAADLAVVNLETSVGDGGRPEPGKRFTFQAPAQALTALAAAGIDVATMANNHALDYGRAALPNTFAAIDAAPLEVVGIGRDAREAFRPALTEVDGTVVATLGATVAALDPTADPTGQWAATATRAGTADAVRPGRLLRAVGRAARAADVVVVFMHWGVQGERCPTAAQRTLAGALVARGADVVVGSHAHVLQGAGRLGEGYVAYGLGNYAWYQPSSDPAGVLTLSVRPAADRADHAAVTRATWDPVLVGSGGLPAPYADRAGFRAELSSLRACASLSATS